MMEFTIFLAACIVILIDIGIASAAREIAQMKGHTSWKYFWYTLGMMPVGLALVIALPDLYARPNAVVPAVTSDEPLPEL